MNTKLFAIFKYVKIWHNYIMKKTKKLLDEYRFPGFRPLAAVQGKFGDNKARIIKLVRRQKKCFAASAAQSTKYFTIGKQSGSEICPAAMPGYIWKSKCGESIV